MGVNVACRKCGYKSPTKYAPTRMMLCPECGSVMPKPKNDLFDDSPNVCPKCGIKLSSLGVV